MALFIPTSPRRVRIFNPTRSDATIVQPASADVVAVSSLRVDSFLRRLNFIQKRAQLATTAYRVLQRLAEKPAGRRCIGRLR